MNLILNNNEHKVCNKRPNAFHSGCFSSVLRLLHQQVCKDWKQLWLVILVHLTLSRSPAVCCHSLPPPLTLSHILSVWNLSEVCAICNFNLTLWLILYSSMQTRQYIRCILPYHCQKKWHFERLWCFNLNFWGVLMTFLPMFWSVCWGFIWSHLFFYIKG